MTIEAGQQLLHYRLIEKIGEGGMGVVWEATDTRLDRNVAIKILPQELTQDPERCARFHQEARLAAAFNHPNIATVHNVGEHDGVLPGCLSAPHGYGMEYPGNEPGPAGPCLNLLTATDHCDPLAKTPYHKHVPVRLKRVA